MLFGCAFVCALNRNKLGNQSHVVKLKVSKPFDISCKALGYIFKRKINDIVVVAQFFFCSASK